ncbi:MAG: acyl-CoA dehydrogenase family protein, partial [Actinomycetota bacterium]
MSFALTSEQLALVEEARGVARDVLVPLAEEGEPGRVNRPLVRALAEHGLLLRLFPNDGEVSATTLCLLREAVARECVEAETALALQG